jgi:hypothetical protein
MPRRSNKTKKASVKRRRFTWKQRGSGFFNTLVSAAKKLTTEMKSSAVASNPVAASKPVAAASKPVAVASNPVAVASNPVAAASNPVASVQAFDKNHPIIKLLGKVNEVVINYIKDKNSFCDNIPSRVSKGLSFVSSFVSRRPPPVPKFKSAEDIFDGLLQFLYNNRQTYVDAVFQLKKQFGINAEIDVLRPFLGRIPIPFAVTIIKKVFFAEPGHLSGIYESINTVTRDPNFEKFCTTTTTNSDLIALAKKLIRQIADKMKLPMKIKAALASESW